MSLSLQKIEDMRRIITFMWAAMCSMALSAAIVIQEVGGWFESAYVTWQPIADAVSSARFADAFSDEISINPLNVQRGTYVERMWKRGEFRSPWIWSLIDVFRQLHGTVTARLMSSPSGGGAMRGVHNCGACDQKVLDAIESFSFSQNIDDLDVKCDCISKWENYRVSEQILGSPADLDRDFENELVLRK